MKVLVVNCGSSSLKYRLFEMPEERELARGLMERVGKSDSRTLHTAGGETFEQAARIDTHNQGVRRMMELLITVGDPPPIQRIDELDAMGHRVVHGGDYFSESVLVDDEAMELIEACGELAPLHVPANLLGLRAGMRVLSGKPQAAVFDTAFFHHMPPAAYHYAVPYEWYQKFHIRRYGFHGTSHRFVAHHAAERMSRPDANLITLHLGAGCSMACIREGVAVDATMGLTPLEGLVMGTRSGDIDPAMIFHLVEQGMSLEEVHAGLERQSGLLGLSGKSSDLRDVWRLALEGDERAKLAVEVFAHRVRKYIGAFLAELGTCDALVFTGGIGENARSMREQILERLAPLGIELDYVRNRADEPTPRRISRDGSRTQVWVISTNEELMIARDTHRLASEAPAPAPQPA
jgi:acetate kinase